METIRDAVARTAGELLLQNVELQVRLDAAHHELRALREREANGEKQSASE